MRSPRFLTKNIVCSLKGKTKKVKFPELTRDGEVGVLRYRVFILLHGSKLELS